MPHDQNTNLIRFVTHRAARCPWCGGPVMRDDRLVEGFLQRVVACLKEDSCGWSAVLDEACLQLPAAPGVDQE